LHNPPTKCEDRIVVRVDDLRLKERTAESQRSQAPNSSKYYLFYCHQYDCILCLQAAILRRPVMLKYNKQPTKAHMISPVKNITSSTRESSASLYDSIHLVLGCRARTGSLLPAAGRGKLAFLYLLEYVPVASTGFAIHASAIFSLKLTLKASRLLQ